MRVLRVLLVLVAISAVALPVSATDKKQLAAAMAAVDANMKTAEGKAYDEQAGKEFGEKDVATVRDCAKDEKTPPATFDMYVKLDGSGKVLEILNDPETAVASCVRNALLTRTFSSPPHGDYWINIHLQFKK